MIAWREDWRFGIPVIRERIFGQDYAKTLAIWRSNFRAAWPHLSIRFRRPVPAGCGNTTSLIAKAGFLSGNIDVRQVVFAKSK